MEKNQATMSSMPGPAVPGGSDSGVGASAPPPPLPPSYEEAMAQSMTMPNPQMGSINVLPYPGDSRVPLNSPYIQPTVQMPQPSHVDGPGPYDYQPPRSLPPSYPITSEIRVVRPTGTNTLASSPVKMQCPSCLTDIKTSTVSDHQPMAHICCLILCILGCCLCSCLPYCTNYFMTVHHFCPRCKIYIGTWKGFEPSRRLMAVRV
ncbi:lipopolysaccharide-induced tumor necrosis factor-alpha factor-like isoform X2 [Microplitis mediator]|nr:lipopolysaccharide-induced tumor necrosis factor-alpha factor-like isoform X2 [Microplitis mediator]